MARRLRTTVHLRETHDGFSGVIALCDSSEPDGLPFQATMALVMAESALKSYREKKTRYYLKNAIKHSKYLVSHMPNTHSRKHLWCWTLASLYNDRWAEKDNPADLDKMIFFGRMAVDVAPDKFTGRAELLFELGLVYKKRYDESGSLSGVHNDLDHAEMFLKQAIDVSAAGSEPPYIWYHLGSVFFSRYGLLHAIDDLEKCIAAMRQAVKACAQDDPLRQTCLSFLGCALSQRFCHTGHWQDGDESDVVLHEAAVGQTEKVFGTFVIATSLLERFRHSGKPAEIDEAVSILQKLTESMDDPEVLSYRFLAQATLSEALQERFGWFRDPKDQEYALSALHDVLRGDLANARSSDRARGLPDTLSNLGVVLASRFEFSKDHNDIDQAIDMTRQAVDLTPDGRWSKHSRLGDLGSLLHKRYSSFGQIVDLQESHAYLERALHNIPEDDRNKSRILRSLGCSYRDRFLALGQAEDLDKSISALHAAVEATPDDFPQSVLRFWDLGRSLRMRFDLSKDLSDIDQAASAFKKAAFLDKGPRFARMKASFQWGESIFQHWFNSAPDLQDVHVDDGLERSCLPFDPERYEESYQALSRMMDLIPPLVWLGDTIAARHDALQHIGGLIRTAATIIWLQYQRSIKAVEWLEEGRSIVWRQQLNLRTPFDELQTVQPALAAQMKAVSISLDDASNPQFRPAISRPGELVVDEAGPARRQLAEQWESLLLDARRVPGFERLLQPKTLPELRRAARIGPIVMLNDSAISGAFVVLEERADILHVPISLSIAQVEQLRADLNNLLTKSNVRSRLYFKNEDSYQPGREMQRILGILWIDVVKPVLDTLGFPVLGKSESHPRIIWCPTGSLAFLPVHAAGDYSRDEPGHRISDYVVSSYTSTISTLLDASNRSISSELRCLTVSQSDTQGLSSLPCTEKEVCNVKQRVGPAKVEELNGEAATVVAVQDAMERCSWIHLACHAIQDPVDPLKSAFCLADGRLELQDIIRKSHPHADFAFLSACQTSAGDQKLVDEAVHLAAGMQLAGYRSIIATMWSIGDEDGPVVADEVYAHLLHDGHPDSSRAAHALHHAVLKLQDTTKPEDRDDKWFLRWVPFIHIGA